MTGWRTWAVLGARILIGLLFLGGAVQKIMDPSVAGGSLERLGLPYAFVWPAMAYDALAALALFAGRWVTPVALSLAVYCIVTSVFHFQPDDLVQMSIFIKNWALAGGCLALAVAAAPGRPSVS